MPHLLQVCNVGNILGGTAACAWTISHALPQFRHTIAFLSPISGETRAAFPHADLRRWDHVSAPEVAALAPDIVLLHNTPLGRADTRLPAFSVQYAHSRISHAPADVTVYCSAWLARQCGRADGTVLAQPVPIPPVDSSLASGSAARPLRDRPIIGRLCTPTPRKWPAELIDFYANLAARFPSVDWEFVGCPPTLQGPLQHACGQRATFHDAGWSARSHLHRWDAMLYHHPALTESFGRTCAESLRAGCIPIVDARGGFLEQIDTSPAQRAGFLCGSFNDFAAALETLHDPAARWRISRTARTHGDDRFSLAVFARQFASLVPRPRTSP